MSEPRLRAFGPGWHEEDVDVPAHTTRRLTTDSGWVLTRVRTGCVRVQRGNFCDYFTEEDARAISQFIYVTKAVPA